MQVRAAGHTIAVQTTGAARAETVQTREDASEREQRDRARIHTATPVAEAATAVLAVSYLLEAASG
ncbi:hypothetical protein R3Q06_34525, partial [Rhodococcus erythropolis]|uniref:hypothetical protein n=1 Tax=Rhodococcus erythropolis TaxID=1833 RepID=UPI002948D689